MDALQGVIRQNSEKRVTNHYRLYYGNIQITFDQQNINNGKSYTGKRWFLSFPPFRQQVTFLYIQPTSGSFNGTDSNWSYGPGSSDRTATGYGLEGPGIEFFRTFPDLPWGPPSFLYKGYRVFPGGRRRPGRDADPSPLLVLRSKNRVDYASTLPKGLRGL
jgi:hypothetical protein